MVLYWLNFFSIMPLFYLQTYSLHHIPNKFTVVIGEEDTLIEGNRTLEWLKDNIKDKRGFSVKEYIEYEYNTAIMYPGKYYHCSQNVENFTSKKSLAIFTNETLHT